MIRRYPSKLLIAGEDEEKIVYDSLNMTEENLKEAVDMIMDWYKKQSHLPQQELPEISRVVATLTVCQMSIEKTKSVLDMEFTARTLFPDVYSFRKILKTDLKHIWEGVSTIAMKYISRKDYSRITIFQFRFIPDGVSLLDILNLSFMVAEYRIYTDISMRDRLVIDMKNMKLSDMAILNPIILKKAEIISKKVYSLHIAGLHFINAPPLMINFVFLVKSMVAPKVAERLKIHPNIEDLYEYIERRVLPKDYGGDDKTVAEISEEWRQELLSDFWRTKLESRDDLKSDESKRIGPSPTDGMFGTDGSFRKLDVD